MKQLIIIGAGGHAKVVWEAASSMKDMEIIGFADDRLAVGTEVVKGFKVLGDTSLDFLEGKDLYFVVAIGDTQIRRTKFENLKRRFKPALVVHSQSHVSVLSSIGSGSVILPGAYLAAGVRVGENTIVNGNVSIDHDTVIGNHVHLAPGTAVGSLSIIGDNFVSSAGSQFPSGTKQG